MKKYYIYIGQDRDGDHTYIPLLDMSENDGRTNTCKITSTWKKPLWKAHVGQIFEVDMNALPEGGFSTTAFSYSKTAFAIARWKNVADVSKWQLQDRANELIRKNIKDSKPEGYAEQLTNIKNAYRTAHYTQKTLILAEVIRIITG